MSAAVFGRALVLVLEVAAAASSDGKQGGVPVDQSRVVFVCAHGNLKSLIASEWFNRLAAERGIAAHAVARGLTPENPVPRSIARQLRRDGIDVSGFEARALAPGDVDGASAVVMIGVEPPAWVKRRGVTVDAWDGIPPASERYGDSRDAMRARIDVLLRDLRALKPGR
jgi:protein-tyrosine-phosphatase